MNRSKWAAIIIVLVLVGVGIWWWQSSASDPAQEALVEELTPEINVVSARITDISDDQIDVLTEVVIKNPFPVELNSSSMTYEVFVDSIKVIQDNYSKPFSIQSGDSTAIELPLQILADPMSEVQEYFGREGVDSAHYALDASVVLDVPIEGEEEFSMTVSDSLPTFQMLKTELADFRTNIFSSDEGVDIEVSITNPNHYPVRYLNGSFNFTIRDEMEVIGQLEDITIPPGGTEEVLVRAEKDWGSLTQSAKDILFNQEDTRFTLHFNATMDSDNNMLDNTEMNLRVLGTLGELSEVMGL